MLLVAFGFLLLEPWHGPTILALSEQHGIDLADLPALVPLGLALAGWHAGAREAGTGRSRRASGHFAPATAIVLGALLVAAILDPRIGAPLVPAGGGTIDGSILHVDGRRAEPVGRWTHLAVTYDGSRYRLYVDGVEASSRSASGKIKNTTDPLWIGGNRPYGEYFLGVIDEVRVYDRALDPAELRAMMSTPIAGRAQQAGLVAAYALDEGHGRIATDASGNGNTGTLRGAKWTRSSRFGRALTFDGAGELVRVPASASLNLTTAMTLTAWIKPRESQSGWRTILHRQTDAYFLTAGGGREGARRLETLDRMRFLLVVLLVASLGWALARGDTLWTVGRRRWYEPAALFVAGSVVDAAIAPSDTLIGPALVAIWCGAGSSRRGDRVSMYALAAAFGVVTILSIADPASLLLPRDAGGVVRSAALGLLLAAAGLLTVRRTSRTA